MRRAFIACRLLIAVGAAAGTGMVLNPDIARGQASTAAASDSESSCRALIDIYALNITLAEFRILSGSPQPYCHVRGTIAPGIRYHVQLPLPSQWNGRLLAVGDGGSDGYIALTANPFTDPRVRQGYTVVNSNSGHDDAVEPGFSFGFNNRQAEVDYGYRAVHLSTIAAKWVAREYYRRPVAKSYFESCSTGGRQALMEAQRFPDDFDGIVAGAPINYFQAVHVNHVWTQQKMFTRRFADNLAFDSDRDGVPDDTSKLGILTREVMAKCDSQDGIADGVIDDPTTCGFRAAVDLAKHACPGDVNGPACFTKGQIRLIGDIYRGVHDSRGRRIIKGFALGSEAGWAATLVPHAGNKLLNEFLTDYVNYLFYENDPGIAVRDLANIAQPLNVTAHPAEYGWWQFNVDDVTAGKGELMSRTVDAKNADLTRFVANKDRKLILWHGWSDSAIQPEPTLDYYRDVVDRTFKGDVNAARGQIRLFMLPGMDHCSGGSGPNNWGDKLAPIVEWVEKGNAPDFLVARHRTAGIVDNERKVCAYPQRPVYTGPAGEHNDRANWTAANFSCR